MPAGRAKGKDDLDDLETKDLTEGARVPGDNPNEQPPPPTRSVLAESGGRLARWFKIRASLVPTERLTPESEEHEVPQTDGERDDSFAWDSTATSSSKSKPKKRPQTQKGGHNPKRRPSAIDSEQSNPEGETQRPRDRRRSSTTGSSRRSSAEIPESSSKTSERTMLTPLQKLLVLETRDQNERIKKLRDEMEEKLEEIREIKKLQVKNTVEEKLASELVEKQREDEEDLEALKVAIRQELEETRLKPFKEKLKSELEERMKVKQAQSRSDMETMMTKFRNDYANQAKVLMLEYEKKVQRELKPALVEAKMKVRQEAAEETQRLEAFIRAQVTHDCQKIDEECDSRIEAIHRERKERQLAIRQRGQETIENHRNRPEKLQELDEKEQSAYTMVEIGKKERLQKQKDIIEAELAQRETLAMATLEREADQKLALTRISLDEQHLKKLQEYIAETEREIETRIKSEKIILAGEKRKFVEHRRSLLEKVVEGDRSAVRVEKSELGAIQVQQSQVAKGRRDSVGKQQPGRQLPEVSQKAESSRSPELLQDDPERPTRTLIEEELLLREARKAVKNLDTSGSSAQKKALKVLDGSGSSAPNKSKVKKVLFEGLKSLKSFEDLESPQACPCVKDGLSVCAPLMEKTVDIIQQAKERRKGRSFAHPHTRESVYARVASEHVVYEEDMDKE